MATKVHMEALSPTMEEGRLLKWLKQEGDPVQEGDVLAEVETDKATMELVARGSGVLRARLLEEGQTAPVGAVIAVIAAPDEDISALLPEGARSAAAAATAPGEASARVLPAAEGAPATPGASGGEAPDGRLKASPLARRLAAEAGVELAAVRGSGPGGRIVKRDIEAALRAAPAAARSAAAPPPYEEVPLSQMRKTIARRLTQSLGPVPHFFLTVEVDMGRALALKDELNRRFADEGARVSVNDVLLKAVASALRRHPEINASWTETGIRRYRAVHLGVAVAVEDGLLTPVLRDADRKGILDISREVRELAARARERKLAPEEYTGSTFSVSNLGMFGIEEFTAVINPPEAAILAVGQVMEKPVAVDGQVVVRPRMRLTLSCDHRVIDGATGARFLATLKAMLEEPLGMLA